MVTRDECAILNVLIMKLLHLFLSHLRCCVQVNQVMFRLCASTKQHISRRMNAVFSDRPQDIAWNNLAMVPDACVSCLPWTTEHFSLLSHSSTRRYAGCHWKKWTHGTPDLWILDHYNSKYNPTDIEWENNTLFCQLCFRSSCSDRGTRPTTLCVSQKSLGKYFPWKDPQSLHAIDAIDLLNTPTDGGVT